MCAAYISQHIQRIVRTTKLSSSVFVFSRSLLGLRQVLYAVNMLETSLGIGSSTTAYLVSDKRVIVASHVSMVANNRRKRLH